MRPHITLLISAAAALGAPAVAGAWPSNGAAHTTLGAAGQPRAAAAAIPCSKTAIARIVGVDRRLSESITTVRCADLTGDGRRDVAWTKFGGGSGGDVQWGIVYHRGGTRAIVRFNDRERYHSLRIRDRRVLIASAVYAAGDPGCCPSGTRTESTRWNGSRFVKRVVSVKRKAR